MKGIAIVAIAALAAGVGHAQMRELTKKDLEELDAIDAKLAPSTCEGTKLYFEMIVVSGVGDAARARELDARTRATKRPPELEALARRKNELLSGAQFPAAGREAYFAAKARREAACPWRKIETPYDLPPAKSAAEARDYALLLVPNFFVGWRLCEVYFPERRGQAQAAWSASPLAKVEIPELRTTMGEVLAWLAEGLAPPAPGSKVERELKDPMQRSAQLRSCDAMPASFRRIEKSFPPDWLAARGKS